MADTQSVERTLKNAYNKVEEAQPRVFRCEKQLGGVPVAIYYFDVTGTLRTDQELTDYQDKLIANDYFAHPGALQWNYYLTFVTDKGSEILSEDKRKIESDVKYTRKFVIEKDDLADFVNFGDLSIATQDGQSDDLLGRWLKKLDKVNLAGVYQDGHRTKVINDYLNGKASTPDSLTSNKKSSPDEKYPHIDAIKLINYRPYPLAGVYECGAVNLVLGPNGTGKTSLLESIEYFFCGKSKRNLDQRVSDSSFAIKFVGQSDFTPFQIKTATEYQGASSSWYRKPTSRGNTLYEGFNQFNFYNADAAFFLESNDDNQRIVEAMASLALGEEANRVSSRIEAFAQDFKKELAALKSRALNIEVALKAESALLDNLQKLGSEQPARLLQNIETRLEKAKFRQISLSTKAEIAAVLKEVRAAIASLVSIPEEAPWLAGHSLQAIEAELQKLQALTKIIDAYEASLVKSEENKEKLKTRISQLRDENSQVQLLQKFLKSGYLDLLSQLKKSEKASDDAESLLGILDSIEPKTLAKLDQDKSLSVHSDTLNASLKQLEKDTKAVDEQIETLSGQVAQLAQLSQSIKKLGEDYLEAAPRAEECPLCHTPFSPAQLRKAVGKPALQADTKGIPDLQATLTKLASSKKDAQSKKASIAQVKAKLSGLAKLGLVIDETKSLKHIFERIVTEQESCNALINKHNEIVDKLNKLSDKGLSDDAFGLLEAELRLVKRPLKAERGYSLALVSKALTSIDEELAANRDDLAKQTTEIEKTKADFSASVKKLLGENANVTARAKDALVRMASLLRIKKQFAVLQASFEIGKSVEPGNLVTELREIEEMFDRHDKLAKVEEDRTRQLDETKKKVKGLNDETKEVKKMTKLAETACKVLDDILKDDSKAAAVKDFIDENHRAIVSIFKRIHSPNEFDDIRFGDSQGSFAVELHRRDPDEWVGLSKISTGQRSAVALSLFLTLNLRTTGGPRLLLIDDPVAHIDDLNTLSFLDFLREIVIHRKRQLFFATASKKMASLFEMKFSGLSENKLVTHKLSR